MAETLGRIHSALSASTGCLRRRASGFVPVFLAAIACVMLATCPGDAAEKAAPNVVVILADDLGYSDLGCYGGEIETPQLDALARDGLRFTQFYNTARCWPTRGALLTGFYAQQIRRDTIPGVPKTGGGGTRPPWAALLPEMLSPLGYRSYHSGKWHIDGEPVKNGFDHSYNMLDQDRFFNPQSTTFDGKKQPAVALDSGYYVTTAIADHAIKCLQEHADTFSGRPFFQFVAFTCPHFPLHALPQDIAKYRERYRVGWEEVREQRYKRQQEMAIVNCALSEAEREVGPPYDFPEALQKLGPGEVNRPLPWSELTEQQREFQATKMAIHAAMVDRMDQEVGRIVAQLRSMDVLDNTLIFFLSDNGASAEIMVRGDGHDPQLPPGSAGTYSCLGPGWSTAANTPFRRHKTWVHEGGISTPLIVHWPKGIAARGELRRNPGHVIDIVPTVLEVTGARTPSTHGGVEVPPAPGASLAPTLAQDNSVRHEYLWWLHEGNRAIRVGNWKLVAAGEDAPWELYDLSKDRAESHDLAAQNPDKVQELTATWQARLDEFRNLATAVQE